MRGAELPRRLAVQLQRELRSLLRARISEMMSSRSKAMITSSWAILHRIVQRLHKCNPFLAAT
jgi:hypothetical protein